MDESSSHHVHPESRATDIAASQLRRAPAVFERLVQRGEELGVVRRDLPEGLLAAMAAGAAEAADRFMVDAWETFSPTAQQDVARRLFDILRTMGSPPPVEDLA